MCRDGTARPGGSFYTALGKNSYAREKVARRETVLVIGRPDSVCADCAESW